MAFNIVQGIIDIAVLAILVMMSVADFRTRLVPVALQYALAACAALHFVAWIVIGKDTGEAVSFLFCGAFVFAIYIGMFLIFKSGIGGADTKVTSLLAAYLGLWTVPFMVAHFVAAMGYTGYKTFAKHQKIKAIPLMPFLAIGYAVTKIIYWVCIACGTTVCGGLVSLVLG